MRRERPALVNVHNELMQGHRENLEYKEEMAWEVRSPE